MLSRIIILYLSCLLPYCISHSVQVLKADIEKLDAEIRVVGGSHGTVLSCRLVQTVHGLSVRRLGKPLSKPLGKLLVKALGKPLGKPFGTP